VQRSHTILVASRDPNLADTRKKVLEEAGYTVIAVREPSDVSKTCSKQHVSLLLIGYSVAPAQKRLLWQEARKVCKVPVLELHRSGEAELLPSHALFFHEAKAPDDFLHALENILKT
jgi:DNA-binding response OmpR family regulator